MKKILIVVDMQNDFIDGSLGTKEAESIVNSVVEEINKDYSLVIATRDTHPENYLETMKQIVKNRFAVSKKIIDTDYYSYLTK